MAITKSGFISSINDLIINDDATELLIEQIGTNLRQFDCELDKLKLMAYPEKTVTKKMVEEIAISNQDLFNITELIIKNQKDKALLEFQKLIEYLVSLLPRSTTS